MSSNESNQDIPNDDIQPTDGMNPNPADVENAETAPDELAELKAAVAQLKEDRLREQADLQNQRKRLDKQMDDARKFANERLLKALLPVIDSLEAALNTDADSDKMHEGVTLTLKQLLKVTEENGLVPVDAENAAFNPELHQAMQMVEHPDAKPNTVVNVFQKGYVLNDRLVRPAMVVVSK